MTVWTLTPSEEYTSFTTIPSFDKYCRKASKYESKTKENAKKKYHRIIVQAYIESGGWLAEFWLYVLF